MTDKQITFKCDVDCKRKNTEECFELDCIKGQESILKQLKSKEQECEALHGYISRLEEELEIEEAEAIRAEVIMLEKTEEADKYKQALTEIKEIAYELTNEEYTDFIEEKQAQILQKCEVIHEN